MDITCRHSRGIQVSPEHNIADFEYYDDMVLFVDSIDIDELQTSSTICQESD